MLMPATDLTDDNRRRIRAWEIEKKETIRYQKELRDFIKKGPKHVSKNHHQQHAHNEQYSAKGGTKRDSNQSG